MTDSNWTLRFPRTSRCDGHAIYYYRTPLWKRLFFALIKHGWWLAFLAVILLTGCAGEIDYKRADAANLQDAIAQAKAEYEAKP